MHALLLGWACIRAIARALQAPLSGALTLALHAPPARAFAVMVCLCISFLVCVTFDARDGPRNDQAFCLHACLHRCSPPNRHQPTNSCQGIKWVSASAACPLSAPGRPQACAPARFLHVLHVQMPFPACAACADAAWKPGSRRPTHAGAGCHRGRLAGARLRGCMGAGHHQQGTLLLPTSAPLYRMSASPS